MAQPETKTRAAELGAKRQRLVPSIRGRRRWASHLLDFLFANRATRPFLEALTQDDLVQLFGVVHPAQREAIVNLMRVRLQFSYENFGLDPLRDHELFRMMAVRYKGLAVLRLDQLQRWPWPERWTRALEVQAPTLETLCVRKGYFSPGWNAVPASMLTSIGRLVRLRALTMEGQLSP